MKPVWLLAMAISALSACGGSSVATVAPATGPELTSYSEAINARADRQKDASLYEYFCHNALGTACPRDIQKQLKSYRFVDAGTRLNLADAFVRMKMAKDKGDPLTSVSDEEYVDAAYKVALGRAADPQGRAGYVDFIRSQEGQRQVMLGLLLKSEEFRSK